MFYFSHELRVLAFVEAEELDITECAF
jgi:hypothetical protein